METQAHSARGQQHRKNHYPPNLEPCRMRKTSKFARKRQNAVQDWDRTASIGVLQRCRPYTDELPAYLGIEATQGAAEKSIAMAKDAFKRIAAWQTPPDDTSDFDHLVHAVGISCIRAIQIAGEDADKNEMLPPLRAGNVALKGMLSRRRKWGKWELTPQEVSTLDWAIEIYETIVMASSPAQMVAATDLQLKAFGGAVQEQL